jgi:hypothetical protein
MQEENMQVTQSDAPRWIWIGYILFPLTRFLAVILVLLWACANAMLHSFDNIISEDQQILSPRFAGLILIPIASTAAEVNPEIHLI